MLEYFDGFLKEMTGRELAEYLRSREPWRDFENWRVLKNPNEPCIAYAAQITDSDDVTIVALGACYRYPNGSQEEWWAAVLLPRLRKVPPPRRAP